MQHPFIKVINTNSTVRTFWRGFFYVMILIRTFFGELFVTVLLHLVDRACQWPPDKTIQTRPLFLFKPLLTRIISKRVQRLDGTVICCQTLQLYCRDTTPVVHGTYTCES
jgi:hypothetical protein